MITFEMILDEVDSIEKHNKAKEERLKLLQVQKKELVNKEVNNLLLFLGVDSKDPNWTIYVTPREKMEEGDVLSVNLDYQKLGSISITTNQFLKVNEENGFYFWDKPCENVYIESYSFTKSQEAQQRIIDIFARKYFIKHRNVL